MPDTKRLQNLPKEVSLKTSEGIKDDSTVLNMELDNSFGGDNPNTDVNCGKDDLLGQISDELQLSQFCHIEDVQMTDAYPPIYDCFDHDENSLFADILNEDVSSASPLNDDVIKCESAPVNSVRDPPSPTNSDSADSGIGGIGSNVQLPYTPSTSPPYSASNLQSSLSSNPLQNDASIFVLNETPPKVQIMAQQLPPPPEIITVSDLSNMKIQIPKITKPSPVALAKSIPSLMLTTEQLAQLTQSGVLKASGPQQQPQPLPFMIKSEPVINANVSTPNTQTTLSSDSVDLKILKRQQRMIKNRESACLSRKKKKDYVNSLEDKLNSVLRENEQLKKENEILRQRVCELEVEKPVWFEPVFTNSNSLKKKGSTVVFIILFLFGIKFTSSRKNLFYSKSVAVSEFHQQLAYDEVPSFTGLKTSKRIGRSLKWVADDEAPEGKNSSLISSRCLTNSFNKTESIRLENQLRGWFVNDRTLLPKESTKQKRSFRNVRTSKRSRIKSKTNKNPLKPQGFYDFPSALLKGIGNTYQQIFQANKNPRSNKFGGNFAADNGEIEMYDGMPNKFFYDSVFEAIDKRDDTFYVVSFSGDHFLLPAAAQNQSSRPVMSLILPALPKNDSVRSSENRFSMMQIDCVVMNTKLVRVKEDPLRRKKTKRNPF